MTIAKNAGRVTSSPPVPGFRERLPGLLRFDDSAVSLITSKIARAVAIALVAAVLKGKLALFANVPPVDDVAVLAVIAMLLIFGIGMINRRITREEIRNALLKTEIEKLSRIVDNVKKSMKSLRKREVAARPTKALQQTAQQLRVRKNPANFGPGPEHLPHSTNEARRPSRELG